MEAHLSFIGLIAAIGVIHLVTMAARHLGALRGNRSADENNPPSETEQRDDWYVFFHCADLLGKEPSRPTSERTNTELPAHLPQQRRENGQRSRTRARL